MTNREKDIERQGCEYAERLGFMQRKFTCPTHNGVPDRLYWGYGTHFLIEYKKPGGKLRASQVREIQKLRDAGATVFVVDNFKAARDVISCMHTIHGAGDRG